MDRTPAATALCLALHQLVSSPWTSLSPNDCGKIRGQVCDAVDEFKANAWPPEQTLIAVKHLAAAAGVRPSTRHFQPYDVVTRETLFARVSAWCLDRYFDAAPQRSEAGTEPIRLAHRRG